MTLEEFWKTVEGLGWGHKTDGAGKTTDYKKVKKVLMQQWTQAQAKEADEHFSKLRHALYKKLDATIEGVGDDGFGDLIAHIIGLGKAEYDKVLANPELANERVSKRRFVESFSYCLPYKDDYLSKSPDAHAKSAKAIVSSLEEGLKDDRFEPVYPQMRALMDLLAPAVAGDPLAILPSETASKELHKEIKKRAEWLWRDVSYLNGAHFAVSAALPNLFGDIREYLL